MDSNLIKVMPASTLISLLLVNYESAEVRLSKGPLPPGQSNPIGDAVNLSRLGSDFRSDVLDFCKRMANEQFIEGNFARAEQLYDTAFQAGTNDATVTINRAAALLKIER